MDTLDLLCVIHSIPCLNKIIKNVVPIDFLPAKIEDFPCSYIFNQDKSSLPGSHWLYLYFKNKEEVIFFDSLGNSPEYYKLDKYLENMKCTYNSVRVQSKTSNFCGYFCLYVAYMLSHDSSSFACIIKGFDKDQNVNDYIVHDYIVTLNINMCREDMHTNCYQSCRCIF